MGMPKAAFLNEKSGGTKISSSKQAK